jgi:methylglutaconyl-CoA hydratase
MASYLQYKVENRLAYITLDRPDKKNALNNVMIEQLKQSITTACNDSASKIIIIHSSGNVFSSGLDLESLQKMQNNSFEENFEDSNRLKELFLQILECPKIVIAQVEGHAIAGGCGLATACDFCFATPESKFGYSEVRIGFIPALVGVFLQRKIMGTHVRELLLTGKLIAAAEAKQIGLINDVADSNQIAEVVKNFALTICEGASAQSLTATKFLLNETFSMPLQTAMSYAAEQNARIRSSEDCKRGVAAFLNKEKLSW